MFCKKCGNQIHDDAAFCPYCRTPITSQQPTHQTSSTQPQNNYANGEKYQNTNADNGTSKKSNGGLIAVIVILIVIIAGGLIYYFCVYRSSVSGAYEVASDAWDKYSNAAAEAANQLQENINNQAAQANLAEDINPFAYVEFSFSGADGQGCISITTKDNRILSSYFSIGSLDGKLKNGDNVEVTFNEGEFYSNNPGVTITCSSMTVTVSGLSASIDLSLPYDLQVPGSANGYILPNSDTEYYTEEFLTTFTDKQLRYARNEITARGGRMFVDQELQAYFNARPWYRGSFDPEYYDNVFQPKLNAYEKANQDLINKIESSRKKK